MKEKVHGDSTEAARTPLMIYWAELNDYILWIYPWQNERQQSINDCWSGIIGNLCGDRLQPFGNAVTTSFIGKPASHMLPAPFRNWDQWCVNDFWYCIIGTLCGNWLQPFIDALSADFISKRPTHTLPARFWNWTSNERHRSSVLQVR